MGDRLELDSCVHFLAYNRSLSISRSFQQSLVSRIMQSYTRLMNVAEGLVNS